jgi:hypothetical protein
MCFSSIKSNSNSGNSPGAILDVGALRGGSATPVDEQLQWVAQICVEVDLLLEWPTK